MKNKSDNILEFPFLNHRRDEKGIEFRKNKIVPQNEEIRNRISNDENEWQQEYFIIYNSYVLEKADK